MSLFLPLLKGDWKTVKRLRASSPVLFVEGDKGAGVYAPVSGRVVLGPFVTREVPPAPGAVDTRAPQLAQTLQIQEAGAPRVWTLAPLFPLAEGVTGGSEVRGGQVLGRLAFRGLRLSVADSRSGVQLDPLPLLSEGASWPDSQDLTKTRTEAASAAPAGVASSGWAVALGLGLAVWMLSRGR